MALPGRDDVVTGARQEGQGQRVMVIGSGTRFLSGISHYTARLAEALATHHTVSVVLMRQLLPSRFYPGQARVGANLDAIRYEKTGAVYDGVDWHWVPSIFGAVRFLLQQQPDVLVFQWWTGTVLHTYILLTWLARLMGKKVIIEFHEVVDTAEAQIPFVRAYLRVAMPLFSRLAHGFVIHSEFDRPDLEAHYRLGERPVAVIPLGPFDQYQAEPDAPPLREAPAEALNILYFGVIRPYKGLEDLVAAFDALPEEEIANYWLTVVGEPWEDYTLPLERIAASRYRERITVVDRYVHDEEVPGVFAGADVVALPYRRSSASGPVHITMNWGLPLIVSRVGGLEEAVQDYPGTHFIRPQTPEDITAALQAIAAQPKQQYTDPHSWDKTRRDFEGLFAEVGVGDKPVPAPAPNGTEV